MMLGKNSYKFMDVETPDGVKPVYGQVDIDMEYDDECGSYPVEKPRSFWICTDANEIIDGHPDKSYDIRNLARQLGMSEPEHSSGPQYWMGYLKGPDFDKQKRAIIQRAADAGLLKFPVNAPGEV